MCVHCQSDYNHMQRVVARAAYSMYMCTHALCVCGVGGGGGGGGGAFVRVGLAHMDMYCPLLVAAG